MLKIGALVTLACSQGCGTWHDEAKSVCPTCGAKGETIAMPKIEEESESERVVAEWRRRKEVDE